MVSNDAASSKKALLMGCDFNVKSGTTVWTWVCSLFNKKWRRRNAFHVIFFVIIAITRFDYDLREMGLKIQVDGNYILVKE